MRDAWECSRTGHQNVACQALADAIGYQYPYFEHINAMIVMNGFLNGRENGTPHACEKIKSPHIADVPFVK